MNRKSLGFILILIILVLIFLNTSLWMTLRSYIAMFFYSKVHENNSLLNKHNIQLKIPGGLSTTNKDWYPFVMTFNDDTGFSRYYNRNFSLTILYNFGHFEVKDGSSSYYNPNSKYFSSFYGGYLVKNNDGQTRAFGFYNDGRINSEEISLVPEYDQKQLVLGSLGCPRNEMRFDVSINDIKYNVNYINHENWVKIDSTIITNSPLHRSTKNHRAYIQYGKPIDRYYAGKDFPIIELKGRTYVKYLEDYDMSIFLYILSPDMSTIEECDKAILSKTILEKKGLN